MRPRSNYMHTIKFNSNWYYILGILATDGNIHNYTISLAVQEKDIELVEYFSEVFSGFNVIRDSRIQYMSSGYECKSVRARVNNAILRDYLINLGISSNKSFNISKVVIPDNYWFDFLRGCFDGDGYIPGKSSHYHVSLYSASEQFLTYVNINTSRLCNIHPNYITYRKSNNIWELYYSKKNTVLLRDYLYKSSGHYLHRKKIRFYNIDN